MMMHDILGRDFVKVSTLGILPIDISRRNTLLCDIEHFQTSQTRNIKE